MNAAKPCHFVANATTAESKCSPTLWYLKHSSTFRLAPFKPNPRDTFFLYKRV